MHLLITKIVSPRAVDWHLSFYLAQKMAKETATRILVQLLVYNIYRCLMILYKPSVFCFLHGFHFIMYL